MPTPYDGKSAVWHTAGSNVGEDKISDIMDTFDQQAPNIDAIFVKTSNGAKWQAVNDNDPDMEITGPDAIAKWVQEVERRGREFHAWCVPWGIDVATEIDIISRACLVDGVKSMIMDVEPFAGFWKGTRDDAIRLMEGIRTRVGDDFHIGLSSDPRIQHYNSIFPDAWQPYVDSVHPQVYWEFMGREASNVLAEAYMVWGKYGVPIYPVLQGWNVTEEALRDAADMARSVRGAGGLSYFQLGRIGPIQYAAINDEVVDSEEGPDKVIRFYDWEKIVSPYVHGYIDGTHTGQPTSSAFQEFVSVRGHRVKYKQTKADTDEVWAQWIPQLPTPGTYEISIYIPSLNATTTEAQYHIHGLQDRPGTELLVRINQSLYANQWVPIVVYDFESGTNGGRVNLTDLTGESDKKIAFGAVRWRRVVEQESGGGGEPGGGDVVQGYDPPVGTAEERIGSQVWPGSWVDATGYATYYTTVGAAYHTGVDLNNNSPRWDSDRGAPIYSTADGIVTFSGVLGYTWGHVIVVRHDPLPDGTITWARYAHVQNPSAIEGDRVARGEQIAEIGNAFGKLAYHLHFDILKTDICEQNPGHWPGTNLRAVYDHYHDPKVFIRNNRPQR